MDPPFKVSILNTRESTGCQRCESYTWGAENGALSRFEAACSENATVVIRSFRRYAAVRFVRMFSQNTAIY